MTAPAPDIVILGHHKIGPIPENGWKSWYYVPEETFALQLQLLKDRGYAFLTLEAFLHGLSHPETFPAKGVLITFDDGYRSLLRHALPPMQAVGAPGVVFVPTDWVGKNNDFDLGVEPPEAIATWEELAAMEKGGLAVQSHGRTHRGLSTLAPADLREEIEDSKKEIEERLGRPVAFFSFPFGDNAAERGHDSPVIEALLRESGYRAACVYGGDPVPLDLSHPYRLTRIAMGEDTDLAKALDSRPISR
ncbi:Peptidoglycan/xylan/chitin deacetylase, PgdA/CDA1 family [Verrucomicrobium sp. GAS474]|uniref:polysaccharide deacetylase family protein n=1 Tax=Verrucomicrobium sp. GAS474 TaxID=1882831 RepID=UPI00087D3211|nr:polysaccharide deacetylase family protein [Verrucomicrobium sp. GAS474]SDU11130.1 Peptidoglycan/xylan/chitin deacetylase, PgdA/CDA1 family [Verrucomicrobium sp. GAS474]